ncbi:hypothetical protein D1641_13180 [Colidextribacter sp. OB.20]|uniref:hypothetical protein n=1 Tax=Colidextribacter sp. OB.20 TaxID=2304568 RepID=UPI00136D5C45|nr:hypothetical protein [Colidextribacter sp. OB.20]NBI10954.1 hypothetical protein [Colidextribacter sp. OB.20]
MLKHYEENFAEMTPQEKENFLGRFSCLSLTSDYINDLFALIVYTRALNTQRTDSTPEVLPLAFDLLWDAMASGETVITEELRQFEECLQAAACMIVNCDDSYMDTPEKEDFYHKYFDDWDHRSCNSGFLEMFGHLFFDIVEENGESPDRVGELLECWADSYIAEELGMDESAPLNGFQWDKRRADVHASPIFCDIIARLQEDMREAMSGKPAGELRERYQTLGLFSEEELRQFRA